MHSFTPRLRPVLVFRLFYLACALVTVRRLRGKIRFKPLEPSKHNTLTYSQGIYGSGTQKYNTSNFFRIMIQVDFITQTNYGVSQKGTQYDFKMWYPNGFLSRLWNQLPPTLFIFVWIYFEFQRLKGKLDHICVRSNWLTDVKHTHKVCLQEILNWILCGR